MPNDRDLGMDRKITRRNFIEGASVAIAGSMLPGETLTAAPGANASAMLKNYPPGQSGMLGSHAGSFEVAHKLAREGHKDWGPAEDADGVDQVVPALWAMVLGLPGLDATSLGMFKGLINWGLRISREPYIYHFPDGNASVARLLVRRLIPGVASGNTMEDIVGAAFDYSRLDRLSSPVRLRLGSTAVHVRNSDDVKNAKEAEITYIQGGKTFQVRSHHCVLACYNRIIPHLCPQLPARQKEALSKLVKVPLVYTNVLLRNWQPWQKLGIGIANCPGTYHHMAMLDLPVSLGSVEFSREPEEPVVAHLNRMPSSPGLSPAEQSKAGRMELLTTSFETIDQAHRALGDLEG